MVKAQGAVQNLGPVGERVAENIRHLRGRMTYRELSERLEALGRPIPVLGLSRIESKARRVDADDLVALAIALDVNPNRLLLPFTASGEVEIEGVGSVPAREVWQWAEGQRSLVIPPGDDGTAEVDFQTHARPNGVRQYNLATPSP